MDLDLHLLRRTLHPQTGASMALPEALVLPDAAALRRRVEDLRVTPTMTGDHLVLVAAMIANTVAVATLVRAAAEVDTSEATVTAKPDPAHPAHPATTTRAAMPTVTRQATEAMPETMRPMPKAAARMATKRRPVLRLPYKRTSVRAPPTEMGRAAAADALEMMTTRMWCSKGRAATERMRLRPLLQSTQPTVMPPMTGRTDRRRGGKLGTKLGRQHSEESILYGEARTDQRNLETAYLNRSICQAHGVCQSAHSVVKIFYYWLVDYVMCVRYLIAGSVECEPSHQPQCCGSSERLSQLIDFEAAGLRPACRWERSPRSWSGFRTLRAGLSFLTFAGYPGQDGWWAARALQQGPDGFFHARHLVPQDSDLRLALSCLPLRISESAAQRQVLKLQRLRELEVSDRLVLDEMRPKLRSCHGCPLRRRIAFRVLRAMARGGAAIAIVRLRKAGTRPRGLCPHTVRHGPWDFAKDGVSVCFRFRRIHLEEHLQLVQRNGVGENG